ncbi:CHAT domain-containing protein [Streptomyces paradoxus]|uniref:CHAT domain-containing protein n=1 Tax=Streptomyces paradoxus TaxID=66375 RepID=UPI0036FCF12C
MTTVSGTQRDESSLPPAPPRDAVDVATLLSTTVRVEPELLRAVRVELLPHADVAAESDLWFSQWVATRNPRAMVLFPDVQRELTARLPEVLARCASPPGTTPADHLRDLIVRCHQHLSPLMQVEEEVLWSLALGGDSGNGLRQAEEALRSVLRALVEHEGRESIADWIVSVGQRLPEPLRHTVTGWQYRSIASFLEPETSVDRQAPVHLTCRDAALVIDAVAASGETEVPETWIAVRLAGETLHICVGETDEPGTLLVSAHATDPVVLELRPGTDERARTQLHVRPGERRLVNGCGPATRLITADGRVYDPSRPAGSRPGDGDTTAVAPPCVFLSPRSTDDRFSQWVYDRLHDRLRRDGYEIGDLEALWPSTEQATSDAPWPVRMDAAVFLLDRELIDSLAVRDQIEMLSSWAAGHGAPKPLLIPLRGLGSPDRDALTLRGGVDETQWVPDTNFRSWGKDHPWRAGHAREIADEVAHRVRRLSTVPHGKADSPTRYEFLTWALDRHLQRYTAHGDRAALDHAVGLFSPDLEAPSSADESAVPAFVHLARAWCHHARLTAGVADADRAVRLLRRALDDAFAATEPASERGARLAGLALHELLRAWLVRIELTGDGLLAEGLAAGLDEAVRLGRESLGEERMLPGHLELTARLAPLAASDAWLRRHPGETESTARLNLEAADTQSTVAPTERVTAARAAARLAMDAGSMPLAVRAFDRWFTLLELTDWERIGTARFDAVTRGFSGAPENAAACAIAAGRPPEEALRLLERGLAVHQVILAGRALHADDDRSCQPLWRRLRRLRREVSRLKADRTPDTLRTDTGEGPAVVLTVAALRGDALILDADRVTTMPLPGLTAAAARRWSAEDPAFGEALLPVMRELERRSSATDGSRTPRVFWCPTGPLSRLPVHEVWCGGPDDSLPVPSYTSLSRLLGSRRLGAGPAPRPAARPVVVVSPGADDTGWDEHAWAEVQALRRTGMAFDMLVGGQATRLAVLEAASQVDVVHFVCRQLPTRSQRDGDGWAIVLADGLLTAADIAAADLSGTRLVVLSGYGEAVGAGSEPDRDTLCGSFQRAGCRHVVTSLSPAGVSGAGSGTHSLVTRFYEALLDSDRRPRLDRVPFALHEARAADREKGDEGCSPHYFVHIGS